MNEDRLVVLGVFGFFAAISAVGILLVMIGP
jgi:hypothetical protein